MKWQLPSNKAGKILLFSVLSSWAGLFEPELEDDIFMVIICSSHSFTTLQNMSSTGTHWARIYFSERDDVMMIRTGSDWVWRCEQRNIYCDNLSTEHIFSKHRLSLSRIQLSFSSTVYFSISSITQVKNYTNTSEDSVFIQFYFPFKMWLKADDDKTYPGKSIADNGIAY